ncbi:MAG: NAD(P)-dependent oxidoreductase [Bacteriovoracaceae bacterium]
MLVQRLHLSSYYPNSLIEKEKRIAQSVSLKYLYDQEFHLDAQVVLSSSQTKWTEAPESYLKNLKLIIHPNSGHDNFPPEIFYKGFKGHFIKGNSIRAQAVAEYNLGAFIQHFINIPFLSSWDRQRSWPHRKCLNTLKAHIYGMGLIGSKTYHFLKSLGVEVSATDPYRESEIPSVELKGHVDAVILCTDLNPTTSEFISNEILSKINPQGCLINASRGKVINQEKLLNFLKKNPQVFAYLDVLKEEPPSEDLQKTVQELNNLSVSSHVAGVYNHLSREVLNFEAKVLKDFVTLTPHEFQTQYDELLLKA